MLWNDCKKFRLNRWTVFEKIEKSRKMAVFGLLSAIFGLLLAMFLTFQSYSFDAFEHTVAPLSVE